jgi:hypothetical protein
MDWKAQLDKATAAIKGVADSEQVKNLTAKAKQAASDVAAAAKKGAASAADAVTKATSDPATLRLHYMGAEISIVSPSDGLQIARPHAGALAIADGAGNALVISLAPPKAQVSETVGMVKKLNDSTFDLGPEDGVNVVVLKP